MTERWRVLLVARGRREPGFGWLLETTLVSLLLGQVLPTAVGGDAVKAIDLSRRTGARAESVSSVVVDKILGLGALVVLAAAGAASGGAGFGGNDGARGRARRRAASARQPRDPVLSPGAALSAAAPPA